VLEAWLGVFEDPCSVLGGDDVKCSTCGEHSPARWKPFVTDLPVQGYVASLPQTDQTVLETVTVEWMRCSNEACSQLVIRIDEQRLTGQVSPLLRTDSWVARPRFGETARPLDPSVPEPFRTDYAEAVALLHLSPRMSAVLSRRILADLLEKYAGQTQFSLAARIDKFISDSRHPRMLRENLHHLREIADFGAHTQKDDQAAVLDIGVDEAEWTLGVLDRFFEHFIVTLARDQKIREDMDERIKAAGRKPIEPLPEDPQGA